MRGPRRDRGISKLALVLIIAGAIVCVISLTLVGAAIMAPQYNKQIQAAHEMAALQSIRTLHLAETQYYSEFGKYADLARLGPPATGVPGPEAADVIPKDLADGKKNGYVFTIDVSPAGYEIHAAPEAFGNTGRRTFYSDQTFVVHQNWTAKPAGADSPEMR